MSSLPLRISLKQKCAAVRIGNFNRGRVKKQGGVQRIVCEAKQKSDTIGPFRKSNMFDVLQSCTILLAYRYIRSSSIILHLGAVCIEWFGKP